MRCRLVWAGSYDDGNASAGCINDRKLLHQLSDYELITKDLLQGVWQRCGLNVCLRGNTKYVRSAQIPGATSPRQLNFIWSRLIFWGPRS